MQNHDLKQAEGKVAYLREAVEIIAELSGAVEREVYAGRVAEQTGLTRDAVLSEVKRAYSRRAAKNKRQQEREDTRPLRMAQPKSRELHYDDPVSATAEKGVIALVAASPELFSLPNAPAPEDFSSEFLGRLYSELRSCARERVDASPAALAAKFTPDELSVYTQILNMPEVAAASREKALSDYIETMKAQKIKSAGSIDLRAVAEQKRRVMVDRYGNN
jgi:DNA primase